MHNVFQTFHIDRMIFNALFYKIMVKIFEVFIQIKAHSHPLYNRYCRESYY